MAKPLIAWMGSKRRLAKHITPHFPEHTCYVEPFAGAGGMFFTKEPSAVEVLNDIDGDLVNLYRVVKYHIEPLYQQFKWTLTSREQWEWLNSTPPETLTDIQRAARFLYLQKLAFGGKAHGRTYGTTTTCRPKLNLLTLEDDLVAMHQRLHGVQIEQKGWQDVVKRYDRPYTLFYLDPPYWQTAGYGGHFGIEEYEAMADMMRTIEGTMIVSINDHPDIRRVFAGLPMIELATTYQVGGKGKSKAAGELLIGVSPEWHAKAVNDGDKQ